jgi:hypothetical protein
MSYEGVRLEVAHAARGALPCSFEMLLPASNVSVEVALVWTNRRDDTWQCGGRVLPADPDRAHAWQNLVDSVA